MKKKELIGNIAALVLFLAVVITLAVWLPKVLLVITMLLQVATLLLVYSLVDNKPKNTQSDGNTEQE
ncbi:Uncharacterised protein [Chlamydia trachomatis]|nr:Uncharacterised protein [Chlamydia trachomatis]